MAQEKAFLSVQEIANILQISRIAVYKKIKNGQLKAKKAGRNYVIDSNDVGGLLTGKFTDVLRRQIEDGVTQVVKDYGETLKMLGKE